MSAKSSTSEPARLPRDRLTLSASMFVVASLLGVSAAALEIGDRPPAIDRPDLSGQKVDLRELEGRVVVVSFWASWCGPCKKEMPVLETLHRRHADDGLVVVGVSIDSRRKNMEGFLRRFPVSFRIVHDPKAEIAARYEPRAMPASFLIGRGGGLRYVHEGFKRGDAERLEARIRSLLEAKPAPR